MPSHFSVKQNSPSAGTHGPLDWSCSEKRGEEEKYLTDFCFLNFKEPAKHAISLGKRTINCVHRFCEDWQITIIITMKLIELIFTVIWPLTIYKTFFTPCRTQDS